METVAAGDGQEVEQKSAFLAALINFFLPGAGYIYCGRLIGGVVVLLIAVPVASNAVLPAVTRLSSVDDLAIVGGFFLFQVVAAVDAALLARRKNRKAVEGARAT